MAKQFAEAPIGALDFDNMVLLQTETTPSTSDDPSAWNGTEHSFIVPNYADYIAFYIEYYASTNDNHPILTNIVIKKMDCGGMHYDAWTINPTASYEVMRYRATANTSTWTYGRCFASRGQAVLKVYGIPKIG